MESSESRSQKRFGEHFDRYTFTGKELDPETGYSYFGARYYDPTTLAAWMSVDPMSDKYPSISPYAYCAWNPLRIADPNGDSLRIDGTDAQKQKVLEYMHQYSHLTFQCDDNGYVSLNTSLSGSEIQTRTDLYINEMIGDPENISIIKIVESNYVEEKGIYMQDNNPTLYGGTSNLNRDDNGIINRVEGIQYLNLNMLGSVCGNDSESKKYPGLIIMHEFSEGFEGCKIARKMNAEIGKEQYTIAHEKANSHFYANFAPGPTGKYNITSKHL